MHKLTLLTAGLLLAAAAAAPQAWGQARPLGADMAAAPTALPSLSTLRYDRTDTLRALQHLFMQRSKAMRGWLEGGTAIMATGAVKKTMVATSSKKERRDNESYYESLDEDASRDLLIGGLMVGYGAYRYTRFGPRQYQRVVAAYQEGQPLPPYLNRKLKTKYFRLLPIGSRKERAAAVGQ
ncbi:hypothetical protein [Hymenobacter actinosclerus]|uniref:Uncharacterized protein n=1 Tax=Hymenobacter actinosclerus TaxID=82805 RepID=A0A1I0EIC1_9BACT|nr:hypothetical protein [Hymenobacter actinosclerus]SET44886.1 hypothetical protein SAMN04487998_1857 [Hymenobacter actinosclerus]